MATTEVSARYARKVKLEALTAYGGAECVRCGEDRLPALGLHHVDRDRSDRVFGRRFYARLRAVGFPVRPRLEVVCANCHAVKHAGMDVDRW